MRWAIGIIGLACLGFGAWAAGQSSAAGPQTAPAWAASTAPAAGTTTRAVAPTTHRRATYDHFVPPVVLKAFRAQHADAVIEEIQPRGSEYTIIVDKDKLNAARYWVTYRQADGAVAAAERHAIDLSAVPAKARQACEALRTDVIQWTAATTWTQQGMKSVYRLTGKDAAGKDVAAECFEDGTAVDYSKGRRPPASAPATRRAAPGPGAGQRSVP